MTDNKRISMSICDSTANEINELTQTEYHRNEHYFNNYFVRACFGDLHFLKTYHDNFDSDEYQALSSKEKWRARWQLHKLVRQTFINDFGTNRAKINKRLASSDPVALGEAQSTASSLSVLYPSFVCLVFFIVGIIMAGIGCVGLGLGLMFIPIAITLVWWLISSFSDIGFGFMFRPLRQEVDYQNVRKQKIEISRAEDSI